MKIEIRALSEIKPYDKNPRINDQAVDAVAESIRRFGFRQPIVIDGNTVIVCGHTRWKAAQRLGLEKVPVHVALDLTPEQIKTQKAKLRKACGKTPLVLSSASGKGVPEVLRALLKVIDRARVAEEEDA